MVSDERHSDSINSTAYQDLIHLTFLCGSDLPLPELMKRFLAALRPDLPGLGVWLHENGQLVAENCEIGIATIAAPTPPKPIPAPSLRPNGLIVAFVVPGVTLTCLPKPGSEQRATDVMTLYARVIALAWRAETLALANDPEDSFERARSAFERRWLQRLLQRHENNISRCALAAGLSRTYIYEMMDRHGLRPRE